jgi:acyl carrier protein
MSYLTPDSKTQSAHTAESIQNWLIDQLAEQLQIRFDQVDIKEPFENYGLNSSQILMIAVKAERQFGFKLSPVLLWHYPTIESLSHRLVEEFSTAEKVFEI